MSGLDNMSKRITYMGGKKQVDRMNEDKLRTLKKALLYSYQSATAILSDGREFRCLINPDKIKNTYDNKYISIPFKDICLNEEEQEQKTTDEIQEIGMKPGDVFTWKENGTDWLVYLRRYEETAYFRAEIRRCKYTVDVNGTQYKCYVARDEPNNIDWKKNKDIVWTDLDYTLLMYITKDENTEAYFHRYTIVKINNKPWEVQSIDNMSSDGIIIIALKEYYQNTIEENVEKEKQNNNQEEINENIPYIEGDKNIYPYDTKTYYIKNAEGGNWVLGGSKAKIINQDSTCVTINVTTGRSGNLELKYIRENENDIILNINIISL